MIVPTNRPVPARIEDRLIVALDLSEVATARAMAERLDGVVSCVELGCDGIIASPDDLRDIRRQPGAETLLVVTPGVRLSGAGLDDHKRAGTPAEAIAAGADYLVVGRPIVQAADPAAMAAKIIA